MGDWRIENYFYFCLTMRKVTDNRDVAYYPSRPE